MCPVLASAVALPRLARVLVAVATLLSRLRRLYPALRRARPLAGGLDLLLSADLAPLEGAGMLLPLPAVGEVPAWCAWWACCNASMRSFSHVSFLSTFLNGTFSFVSAALISATRISLIIWPLYRTSALIALASSLAFRLASFPIVLLDPAQNKETG
jgi:hypothetical protein